MTFNLRSLLVAAIVLSNCITWTASRHHYNHNVQVHRIRHRRQGKGLYLPQSYIIPGGEGVGWGDWGVMSPCSRSCGGGVASQKRICLEFGPDGQTLCRGGDTRYFSCETHDCPPDSMDFRAEQCAKFNDKNFRGSKYSWVPYTNGPNPCELNCMPEGERFYFLHKKKVIDGTRCDENSFDVCVDGVCQSVGCDMKLGSSAREDKCRVCRGNGTNCHTIKGLLDQTTETHNRTTGYNDILVIPAGATTIVIEEVKPSKNYLALRNKDNHFFLNGDYQIDFPKSLVIAGAVWHYERSHTGYLAPDKLRCSGPTNETLILSILLQEENVGVEYEYSIPSELAPSLEQKYEWGLDKFSECSVTCGGGFQTTKVTCRSSEDLEVVEDDLCDPNMKPVSQQSCNTDPCSPEWTVGPWTECSERCGDNGIRNRTVTCTQTIDGVAALVAENECLTTLGKKPALYEKCNTDASCPTWFIGEWKNCDKLIGEGVQTRIVVCYQEKDHKRIKLDDSECEEQKPETTKPCVLAILGVDWITTDWTSCDSCSSTVKTRRVQCANESGVVFDDKFCERHPVRPSAEEPCNKDELPKCEPMWYAGHWSKCSVECGEGVQSRKVFCGIYDNDAVTVVPDEKCADLPRYNDTKPCQVPQEKCPLRWYTGAWSQCKCDGGIQKRFIKCMRGNVTVSGCSYASMPVSERECDTEPCNIDEVMAVDGTKIVDCIVDDNYQEVGLDSIGDSKDTSDGDGTTETSDLTSDGESPVSFGSTEELTTDTIDIDYEDSTTDDAVITSGDSSSGTETTNTDSSSSSESSITSTDLTGSTETSGTDTTISTIAETTDTVDITTGGSSSAVSNTEDGSSTSESSSKSSSDSTGIADSTTEVSSSTDAVVTNTGDSSLTSESSSSSTDTGVTDASTTDTADKSTDISSVSTDRIDSSSTSESSSTVNSGVTDASTDKTTEVSSGSSLTSESSSLSTDNISETDASTTGSTDDTTESGSTGGTDSSSPSESSSSITDNTGVTDASTTGSTDETTESGSTGGTDSSSPSESSSSITDNTGVTDASTTGSTDETTESGSTGGTDSSSTSESSSSVTDNTDVTDASTTGSTEETTESGSTGGTDSSSTSESSSSVKDNTDVTDASTMNVTDQTTEVSSSSSDRDSSSSVSASITSSTDGASTTESGDTTTEVSSSTDVTGASTTESADSTDKTDSSSSSESSSLTTVADTTESTDRSTTSELSTSTPIESTTNIADTSSERSGSSTDSTSESGSSSTEHISSTDAATTESLSSSTESTVTEETPSSTISDASTTESVVSTTLSGSSEKEDSSSTTIGDEGTTESSSESSTTSGDVVLSTETTSGDETTSSTESSSEVTGTGTSSESSTSSGSSTDSEGDETTSSTESSSEVTGTDTSSESSTLSGLSTDSEGPTTESTVSGLTTEAVSSSTPWIYTDAGATCRPKRRHCKHTTYGCCPDGKSKAEGPFDKGCNISRTCKETEYKCCPDGVTPAKGPNKEGCPEPHCENSFYGCCLSDNKTEAQGNDQEGCPPPPPACKSSEFGCCADEETEATGPDGEGCPENETTETTESTEITSEDVTSSTEENSTTEESTTEESTTEEGSTTEETSTTEEYSTEGSTDITTISSSTLQEGCAGTEFGCCPDGVSPAEGDQNLGCCKSSLHGCCEDNKTPAHGPQFEGCCLLTSFGCCPDNHKAAEGPHLEGCGCQNSLHGCCPDNVTIAQGPNNEGCGCQYTEFGCCPDRHSPASGPEYKGCSCHTYQFGCCPDGVSIPEGPNYQGCGCSRSNFGCCGDEKTAATGPDGAGCDCSNSKYGCCLDGQSTAAGPDFVGCETVPENIHAACGLPSDTGSCVDYELRWYYNTTYGGCTQFWYGGCEGNLNKFSSRDECEDVCVHPSPKDACKLPSVKGACDDNVIRWYFNSERKLCEQFAYGKCLGNDNNFETRELCQKQCDAARVTDTCKLPIERGQCAGNFARWGYNSESRRCEQFTWGGCEGNDNRFSSEAACKLRCDTPDTVCSEPQEAGNCTDKEAVWSFSQTENRCMPFYYTGCDGNHNRFDSRDNCEQTCPSSYQPDRCTLPTDSGECRNYALKWFFDTSYKRCRQFYYGGCGGNENRFETLMECESQCSEPFPTTTTTSTTTTTVGPAAPPVQTEPPREPDSFCFLAIDEGGLCEAAPVQTRYAYVHSLGKCVAFQHQGCGGNRNSFDSDEFCMASCQPVEDICQQPMKSGPCDGSFMNWFYDTSSDSCSQFTYGGCEGNDNRFESREDCEAACRRVLPQPTVTTLAPTTPVTTVRPPAATLDEECSISSVLEQCVSSGEVWYLSTREGACVSHYNEDSGRKCRYTGTFGSKDACEARCLTLTRAGVCQAQLDPGSSNVGVKTKYYFNLQTGSCQPFAYGGSGGGSNRFSTVESCNQLCSGAGPAPECLQEVDIGTLENCTKRAVARYYYMPSYYDCSTFTYMGCGGNDNNFQSLEQCRERCVPSGTGCDSYERQCRELTQRCPAVVRSSTSDGCEACACDCEPYRQECDRLRCDHGVDKILDNGCERCVCRENPCANCNEYERCETIQITDPVTGDVRYTSQCIEPEAKPVVLPAPEPEVTSKVGGSARLRCLFHSNPPSRITWRRGEITIDRDVGRYSLLSDGTLEIVALHHNDSGVYICIANNGLGIATQEVTLVVEALDCLVYESECARLQCDNEVKFIPTADGCRRCECDCQPFEVECRSYETKCAAGIERVLGPDGCTRCSCQLCGDRACAAGERCVSEQYKNPYMPHLLKTVQECRQVSKPGLCPVDDTISNDIFSNDIIPTTDECADDAECRGVGKCCRRAGRLACLEPAQSTTQRPVTTTHIPVALPGPPVVLPQTEPEVTVREGERARLRCLFHSNPPPRITWMRGAITIDGTVGRYRLLSDGTLEIVSLYRNDSGVYICIADNGLGIARQEVNLVVTDHKDVGIAGIENAVITGELNKRLEIQCLAYGNPPPSVFWVRGRQMVPFFNSIYEIRGNLLIIKRLTNEILGEYTCKAYNGHEATWVVTVQANMGQVVTQGPFVPPTRRAPQTTRGTTTTTSTTTTTERSLIFEEPVKVHLSTPYKTLSTGADLQLECELDGYPEPTATWTKDRLPIESSNRISITGTVVSRLTISNVAVSDSGLYGCHADNGYSSNAEYAQINIQQLTVPPNCVDNPFFANCSLIVHSRFCIHKYYSQFCCKSCVEAGMLDPLSVADLLADQPYRKK